MEPKHDYFSFPDELPVKPTGWTMQTTIHLNFGGGQGAASYSVYSEAGQQMPFTFGYNTKEKWRGFSLPGVEPVMDWKELRAIWPIWIGRARKKQKAAREHDETGKVERISK